jgi:hypothetical protein
MRYDSTVLPIAKPQGTQLEPWTVLKLTSKQPLGAVGRLPCESEGRNSQLRKDFNAV